MLQTSFKSQGILIFRKTTGDKEGLRKSCQLIKGTDSKLVDMILNEVIPKGSTGVTWADVSGNKEYTYITFDINEMWSENKISKLYHGDYQFRG